MGVTGLWTILEGAKEEVAFAELKGAVLAVDLSLWLCQCAATAVKCDPATIPNLHLRNVFFRTAHLLKNGVRPIFVIDGTAPELKSEEMSRRCHGHNVKSLSRPNLKQPVAECCALFDALGVFYLKSEGEAEALCAYLDKEGLIDGCLTTDGDAFLYGARTVYRDFAVGNKTISRYKMANIEQNLNVSRSALIALAAMAGCDYNAAGAFGVGVSRWLTFTKACRNNERDPVDVLRQWLLPPVDDGSDFCKDDPKMAQIAQKVRDKLPLDTFEGVVAEFLKFHISNESKVKQQVVDKKTNGSLWKCPNLQGLASYFGSVLNWDFQHVAEHVYPLLARFRINEGAFLKSDMQNDLPVAKRIVARRVNHGQAVFEVEWSWLVDLDSESSSSHKKQDFTSLEPVDIFSESYPQMTEVFSSSQKKQLKRAESETTTKKSDIRSYFGAVPRLDPAGIDDLIDNLQQISLVERDKPSKKPQNEAKSKAWVAPLTPKTADGFFGTRQDEETSSNPPPASPSLFSLASIFGSKRNLKPFS